METLKMDLIHLRAAVSEALLVLRGAVSRCEPDEVVENLALQVAKASLELRRFERGLELGIIPIPES